MTGTTTCHLGFAQAGSLRACTNQAGLLVAGRVVFRPVPPDACSIAHADQPFCLTAIPVTHPHDLQHRLTAGISPARRGTSPLPRLAQEERTLVQRLLEGHQAVGWPVARGHIRRPLRASRRLQLRRRTKSVALLATLKNTGWPTTFSIVESDYPALAATCSSRHAASTESRDGSWIDGLAASPSSRHSVDPGRDYSMDTQIPGSTL